jgi:hypothetical protein
VTADHWLSAGIDLAATLDPSGSGGRTAARAGTGAEAALAYDHLVVDRDALSKLWPPDNVWRRTGRATTRGVRRGIGRSRRDVAKE